MDSLDKFFDAAAQLSVGTLMRLAAAHQAQEPEALHEARARAVEIAERLSIRGETDRLVGAISQWAASSAPTPGQYA